MLGAVEEGEQCDDSSDCCENCKFSKSKCAECSYSTGFDCCDDITCKFKPSSTSCENNAGYCGNGKVNKNIITLIIIYNIYIIQLNSIQSYIYLFIIFLLFCIVLFSVFVLNVIMFLVLNFVVVIQQINVNNDVKQQEQQIV
jgi:hypothetical protein